MWLYLCFLIILKTIVNASVFTLIKEENVACVLTEESVYSPLYISSVDDTNTKIESFPKRPLTELRQWISDDWAIANVKEQLFYPVDDIRWESFEEPTTNHIQISQNFTSFSLCFGKNLLLVASDAQTTEMIRLTQKQKVEENFCSWSHFIITENKILQILHQNGSNIAEEVWKLIFIPEWLSFSANTVYAKVHDYNFRFSTLITNTSSYLDVSNLTNSKNLCVALFVSVDVDSILDIVLKTGDTVTEKIEGFNKENDPKKWKLIKIETNNYNGSGELHFYRRRSDDRRFGYWAIDRVHLCKPKTDVYRMKLTQKGTQNHVCRNLNTKDADDEIFCDKLGYFGNDCKIHCLGIFGRSDSFCQGRKICLENGNCQCAWGFQGTTCNKTCDTNFWGLNCTSKYDSTRCDDYNSILGCTKCKIRFFGSQCSEKFPVVLKPPILTSIEKNQIEISVGTLVYSRNETQPEFYQVQYKQDNSVYYVNASNLIPYSYNFTTNEKFLIQNVSTKEFAYRIRVILFTENNFFGDEVPELTTNKKSLVVTSAENGSVELTWNKPASEANNFLLGYQCNHSFCSNVIISNNVKTSELFAKFENLGNLSSCTIRLYLLNDGKTQTELIDQTEVSFEVLQNISSSINTSDYEYCQNQSQNIYFQEKIPISRTPSVQNLSVFCNTDDTLWLKWEKNGTPNATEVYKITFQAHNDKISHFIMNSSCDIWDNFICATITNLKKDTTYNITVRAKNFNSEWSEPEGITASTKFRLSDAPSNVKVRLSQNFKKIILTWDHPLYTHGLLEKFVIDVNNGEQNSMNLEKFQAKYDYKISVEQNKKYQITIFGHNKFKGLEAQANLTVLSPVSNSGRPLVEWCFKECYLLIPGQNNRNFDILVMKTRKKITEEEIKTIYNSVKKYKSGNRDQWIVETRRNNDSDVEAEIGDRPYQAVSIKNSWYSMYFLYEDDSSDLVAHSVQSMENKKEDNSLVNILIVILCTVPAVVFLGYFYVKYKNKKSFQNRDLPITEISLLSTTHNEFSSLEDIKLEELENYLKFSLIGNNHIEQEFQSLPNHKTKPCEIALKHENISKNKNRNYVPYDDTRVILQDFEDMSTGDYINASYIDGYMRPKSYIACQGPKFSTVADFWRMIWQEKVEVIIMASNFIESGESRDCAEYWSTRLNSVCEYGPLVVELVTEKEYQNYYQRVFELEYLDTTRKVRHFQIKWSSSELNHLYPNDILPVVRYLNEVSEKCTSPIVIHSGLGTDRSGTLILCDLAQQMMKYEKKVNFNKLLQKMREQRPHMVKRLDMYLLAHLTVLEFFMEQNTPFKKSIDQILNTNITEEQIKYLDRLYWHDALIQSMIPTATTEAKEGVKIDGYQNRNQFLLQTHPTKSLLLEFWKKVQNENVKYILCLDPLESHLWPYTFKNSELTIEVIELSNVKITALYKLSHLSLKIFNRDKDKEINENRIWFFELKNWTTKATVNLVNTVDNIRKVMVEYENPILLISRDGISSSGLFTILFYVLENYKKELEIDVCKPLRIMKRSHSYFSVTPNNLKFIYDSLFEYFQNVDSYKHVYSN